MSKILVVDDDVDMIEVNRMALEATGHQVTAAYSAREAREALKTLTPDLVVLDVMMEERTAGIALAREIRRSFPRLPVILLTGIQDVLQLPFGFEPSDTWLPVTRVLRKGGGPERLAEEIADVLGTRK